MSSINPKIISGTAVFAYEDTHAFYQAVDTHKPTRIFMSGIRGQNPTLDLRFLQGNDIHNLFFNRPIVIEAMESELRADLEKTLCDGTIMFTENGEKYLIYHRPDEVPSQQEVFTWAQDARDLKRESNLSGITGYDFRRQRQKPDAFTFKPAILVDATAGQNHHLMTFSSYSLLAKLKLTDAEFPRKTGNPDDITHFLNEAYKN